MRPPLRYHAYCFAWACLGMLELPAFTLCKFFLKDRLEELKVRIITFIQCGGLIICRYLSIDYVESLSTKVLHQKKIF